MNPIINTTIIKHRINPYFNYSQTQFSYQKEKWVWVNNGSTLSIYYC